MGAGTLQNGQSVAVTEVPSDNVLHRYAAHGQVTIVGAEAQEAVRLTVDCVQALSDDERLVLRTNGAAAWYGGDRVRDELAALRARAPESDHAAIERALELVAYACSTGTGVAVVPPAPS
jgi:hypothetical protein